MGKAKKSSFNLILSVFIFFTLIVFIRNFVFTFSKVQGESMLPNYKHGDLIFILHFLKNPSPGDVVVFNNPTDKNTHLIKRVLAGPQSVIAINNFSVQINGINLNTKDIKHVVNGTTLSEEMISPDKSHLVYWDKLAFECKYSSQYTTNKDEYFLLGDNRCMSADSRVIGKVHKKDIIGKVIFKIPTNYLFK